MVGDDGRRQSLIDKGTGAETDFAARIARALLRFARFEEKNYTFDANDPAPDDDANH